MCVDKKLVTDYCVNRLVVTTVQGLNNAWGLECSRHSDCHGRVCWAVNFVEGYFALVSEQQVFPHHIEALDGRLQIDLLNFCGVCVVLSEKPLSLFFQKSFDTTA
jgi:hypothetical protein